MWWRDFGQPGLMPSPFFHSFYLWREATGLYWVFNQMCKLQSTSFQGTVPLIGSIWPWRLYVVSFHPRAGVWSGDLVSAVEQVHLRTFTSSVMIVPPSHTSSTAVLFFPRLVSSPTQFILHLTTSEFAPQTLWASPTVLALRISIKSTKSACVCLFAWWFHPAVHAYSFMCVNGCASCDLWLSQESPS